MRVKVEFVVEASDFIREEINRWYGRPGLATRQQVKDWYEANGHSMDDDLMFAATVRERSEELGTDR